MTEELSARISHLTCPYCNGHGTVSWACDMTTPSGAIAPHRNAIPCPLCGGTGINPKENP